MGKLLILRGSIGNVTQPRSGPGADRLRPRRLPCPMKKAARTGGSLLFSLYKFRIPVLTEFSATFCTCDGYEYSSDLKWIAAKTVLWSGAVGVDRISTEAGETA